MTARICRGRCGRTLVHHRATNVQPGQIRVCARELCSACWGWARYHGLLADYERTNRRDGDTVEDWQFLERDGHTRAQAAARLGISKDALEKAIAREKRRQAQAVDA